MLKAKILSLGLALSLLSSVAQAAAPPGEAAHVTEMRSQLEKAAKASKLLNADAKTLRSKLVRRRLGNRLDKMQDKLLEAYLYNVDKIGIAPADASASILQTAERSINVFEQELSGDPSLFRQLRDMHSNFIFELMDGMAAKYETFKARHRDKVIAGSRDLILIEALVQSIALDPKINTVAGMSLAARRISTIYNRALKGARTAGDFAGILELEVNSRLGQLPLFALKPFNLARGEALLANLYHFTELKPNLVTAQYVQEHLDQVYGVEKNAKDARRFALDLSLTKSPNFDEGDLPLTDALWAIRIAHLLAPVAGAPSTRVMSANFRSAFKPEHQTSTYAEQKKALGNLLEGALSGAGKLSLANEENFKLVNEGAAAVGMKIIGTISDFRIVDRLSTLKTVQDYDQEHS